jgi:hypothetical protein
MREADAAAEQARLTETEADRLAQRAKEDADQAAWSPMTAIGGVQRAHKDARNACGHECRSASSGTSTDLATEAA